MTSRPNGDCSFGHHLFRYRGLIGLAGFMVAYVFARPSAQSLTLSLTLIPLGLALRVWASGYLDRSQGSGGRGTGSGPWPLTADRGLRLADSGRRLVTGGPYRYLRNPLYVANFVLTAGGLLCLNVPWWLLLTILGLFVIEYWLIARAEEQDLSVRFGTAYATYYRAVPAILPALRRSTPASKRRSTGAPEHRSTGTPGHRSTSRLVHWGAGFAGAPFSCWTAEPSGQWSWRRARAELHTLSLLVALYALALLRLTDVR